MLCTSHTLLFATCISFLLTRGGDALKCYKCSTISESKRCKPAEFCTLPRKNGTCATAKLYENEKLIRIVYDCRPEEIKTCDTTQVLSNNLRAKISCCRNKDFCND
nr:acrosomal protein SP-10 [Anolis sagrei ordinatus]